MSNELYIYVNAKHVGFTSKEIELFTRLINILEEIKNSRTVFDLDMIFNRYELEKDLKLNIEMSTHFKKKTNKKIKVRLAEVSIEKLFRLKDQVSWSDAFRDEKLLANGEGILSDQSLDRIIERATNSKYTEIRSNPLWIEILSEYINDEQYLILLKAFYLYRFETILIKKINWKPLGDIRDMIRLAKNNKYRYQIADKVFQLGKYQVTFSEYNRYCRIEGLPLLKVFGSEVGLNPVTNVNWNDAVLYSKWLSKVLGVKYKLPTSYEWYLACNNRNDLLWHFGNDENELNNYAWYDYNSDGRTHAVGEKSPNQFGLYDMHGNIWEWCEDEHSENNVYQILRGGSWESTSSNLYSRTKYELTALNKSNNVGFRLLRTLP